LRNSPPAAFTACVIGKVGPDGCVARPGEPHHRIRTEWQLPTIGDVRVYTVYRQRVGSAERLAVGTNDGSAFTIGADGIKRFFFVDTEELPHNLQFTYWVAATFDDDTVSDDSNRVTITAVNDAPVAVAQSFTVNEDGSHTGVLVALVATDSDSPNVPRTIVVNPVRGVAQLTNPATGAFIYTPNPDVYGTDSFAFKVFVSRWPRDSSVPLSVDSNTALVSITINPVNDAPSFTSGANDTVAEDSGPRAVPNWATNISAGPANETNGSCVPLVASVCSQTLTFNAANNNTALFSQQPAISADGTLTYTPAPDANGVATVTLSLSDSGGTDFGGDDTSGAQAFIITVTPVNDPPVAADDQRQTGRNSPLSIPVSSLIANDSAGPANESEQALTLTTVGSPVNGTVSLSEGTVTFTPTADFTGTASFTYTVCDSGEPSACDSATVTITVAASSAGRFAIVTNLTGASASIIDLQTNSVTTTVPGAGGYGASITPDGGVGLIGSFNGQGHVRVIDLTVNPAVSAGNISVPAIPFPESTAITPNGRYAVVSNGGGETDVSSIDLQTRTVVNTITVPSNEAAAITPDGTQVLVLSFGQSLVSVLTMSGTGVLQDTGQRIPLGSGGTSIAISPNGTLAFVPGLNQQLHVLQSTGGTWSLATTINGLVAFASGIAIAPDGSRAYVTGSTQIAVLNIVNNVVSDTGVRITPPAGTQQNALFGVPGLAVTPDGTRLFVVGTANDVVSVIDTSTNTVILTIPVGDGPTGIGMPPP
jgi:YVTN family beta-propeller protein